MASSSSDSVQDQLESILEEFISEEERIKVEEFISFVNSASRNGSIGNLSEERRRIISGNENNAIPALHLAALRGYTSLCEYLIDTLGYNVNAQFSEEDDTPLHAATMKNHFATVLCLIDHGADVNCKGQLGLTPLHMAARQGYEELVRLLILSGSDVEATSAAGTPLQCAVAHENTEVVKVLLENNANPNTASRCILTPLLMSVINNSLVCLELLIKAGANPKTGACGTTPLSLAAGNGLTQITKKLLTAGADPNAIDLYGSTPLENAARQSHYEIVKILFPFTSCNPSSCEWSREGIVQHMNSEEFRGQRELKKVEVFSRAKLEGDEATKRNEYFNAIQWYCVAIRAKPTDEVVYSSRSLCYGCLFNSDRALSDAQSYIGLLPSWPKIHCREGTGWKLLKDLPKTLEAFSMALTVDCGASELQNAIQFLRKEMVLGRQELDEVPN